MDRRMSENYEEVNCDSLENLMEGCRILAKTKGGDWQMAEVLSLRALKTKRTFNLHFLDTNKRLDEWVMEDRLDPSKVYFRKKLQEFQPTSAVVIDVAPAIPLANATPDVIKKKYKKRPLMVMEEELENSISIDEGGGPEMPGPSTRTKLICGKHPSIQGPLFSWKYSCQVCGKGWELLNDYNKHLKRSHVEKNFQCGVCKKLFATESLRTEHAKGHEKRFKCWKCPFTTGYRGNYNDHCRNKTCHGKNGGIVSQTSESVDDLDETHNEDAAAGLEANVEPEDDVTLDFLEINENKYHVYPPMEEHLMDPCECTGDGVKCDDSDCLNRATKSECQPECGENCCNRRIQNREGAQDKIKVFFAGAKGRGVKAIQPIKKGEFILEYTGEVMWDDDYKERKNTIYAGDVHHYCCQLDKHLVIDAHRMGNKCRYVNHGCEPNCEMKKWAVGGMARMALFSIKDIAAGDELSYDYGFSLFNPMSGQPCRCGSLNCRGVIGKGKNYKNK